MKDYSMSLEERKDFMLGYDITDDGQIIVSFAKGEPLPLPHNEKNEQIVLNKMKKQLVGANKKEKRLKDKITSSKTLSAIGFVAGLMFSALALGLDYVIPESVMVILNLVSLGTVIITSTSLINLIYNKIVLNDLKKNIRFLEIEKKLNSNARSENNILRNVSNKTKRYVRSLPEDKEAFNINSFNYVPFRDLEQIIENVDRNERFGFVYDEPKQEDKPKTKKKKR